MSKHYIIVFLFVSFFSISCTHVVDNDEPKNGPSSVPAFRMYFTDERLAALHEEKLLNNYVPAEFEIDGSYFIGTVRSQGAGSRYQPYWSYNVKIPPGKTSTYTQSFDIGAQYADKTLLRTILTTYMCKKFDVSVPVTSLTALFINDQFEGVYGKTDRIDENYFVNNSLPVFELISVSVDARYTFDGIFETMGAFEKKIPDDDNLSYLTEFIHALDTAPVDSTLFSTVGGKYLDIPKYLRFHALMVVVNNVDTFTNNIYLYRSSAQDPYSVIVHDFDNSMFIGKNIALDSGNEIIEKLLKNDSCRVIYYQYIRDILDKVFTEEELFPIIDTYAPEILKRNKAISSFSETSFTTAVKELKTFISARRKALIIMISQS